MLLELLEINATTMAMWVCKHLGLQLTLDDIDAILNGVIPLLGHCPDSPFRVAILASAACVSASVAMLGRSFAIRYNSYSKLFKNTA